MIVIEGSEPDRNKPAAPAVVPPVMRREERQEPDGRRLLLYHFDRPVPPEPAAKKEPTDG